MQPRPAALIAHLIARKPFIVRHLIWIRARNRTSGVLEDIGLWTGDDHQEIVVDGVTRTYYGAGGIAQMEALTSGVGTDIRRARLSLSPMAPEVEIAIRGYDVRQALVEIHRLLIDPETMQAIGSPVRRLSGWIDGVEMTVAGGANEMRCEVTIVTSSRAGTRTLSLKKSDATQRLRKTASGVDDRFYQYADLSGAVPVRWGEK
ncbi:MAG: hypothetical protein DI498_11010 [Paracoccus denitrificans]|nr:MAG: hypothetical protein DI498_11010 [Paracoccus denitrificans]PZO83670.1 MAG: hypothetical protein DI633_11010 [Paracoccus denitrificans]